MMQADGSGLEMGELWAAFVQAQPGKYATNESLAEVQALQRLPDSARFLPGAKAVDTAGVGRLNRRPESTDAGGYPRYPGPLTVATVPFPVGNGWPER